MTAKGLRRCRYNFKDTKCEVLPMKYRKCAIDQVGGDSDNKKYKAGER